jgi:hypothetical protein
VPLALRYGARLADRIAAGPNRSSAPLLGATLLAVLLALALGVKASERLPWGGGLWTMLVALLIWWAFAAALTWVAARRPLPALGRAAPHAVAIWTVVLGLFLLLALAFAAIPSISVLPLVLGLVATALVVAAYGRVELPRLPRPAGLSYDVVAVLLLLVAVPNMVIFYPGEPGQGFLTQVIHFHQNFFLGPASRVELGGAMLVDTLSQYGVASITFIAGWFGIAGTSNGTLGILDGVLHAMVFAGGYVVLRAAGVRRLAATTAMLVALIVLVWGLIYPIGGLLQHGAIRFGMPMGVLVATVAGVRWPRAELPARLVTLAFVGLSSIWALEAFGYTVLTFLALTATRAALSEAASSRRWFIRRALEGLAACIVAHVLFAIGTLAAAGELPDWSNYLNTLREFLSGSIGDLTYDFSPWSPGLGAGALLVASTVGVVTLILRKRDLARRESALVVALAGSTAYGVALFSYLVNRSADHIIPYVCLPVLMAGVLWLALLLRHPELASRGSRRAALALSGGLGTLLVAVAWSGAGSHLSESAIAYLPPGGKSMTAAIDRLGDPPPLSPGAAEAEALLDRHWAGEDEAAVVVEPDLEIEALARTGRFNRIPLSDPWEDSFVADTHVDEVDEAVDDMKEGDLLLVDANALGAFRDYRANPTTDPLNVTSPQTIVPSGLAILQDYALNRLAQRFRLRTVDRGANGLEVTELVDDPIGNGDAR